MATISMARATILSSRQPFVPKCVSLTMLYYSAAGIFFLFSAMSSFSMLSISLFWLGIDKSSDVDVGARAKKALCFIPLELFFCLAVLYMVVASSVDDTLYTTFMWLAVTSLLSFFFSLGNIFWACYNLRKWKQLPGSGAVAEQAEAVGLLAASGASAEPAELAEPAEPAFAAP